MHFSFNFRKGLQKQAYGLYICSALNSSLYIYNFLLFPFIYLLFFRQVLFISWLSWNLLCRSTWLKNHRDPPAFVWAWINSMHHHTSLIVFINENICSIMKISTCEIFVVGMLNIHIYTFFLYTLGKYKCCATVHLIYLYFFFLFVFVSFKTGSHTVT